MSVRLFDESPLGHDARSPAGAGDFERSAAALRAGSAATIDVNLATWHRLPRLFRFASALRGRALPPLPRFDVAGAPRLAEGLHRYIADLHAAAGDATLQAGTPSPDLLWVLEDFDRRANAASRPNLLRLLGALSDEVFIGPHTFHLDVINACNTNCTFCGLHSPLLIEPKNPMKGRRFVEGWKSQSRDFEEFTRLIDDLHAIGCREDILFNGEGEPIIHPRAAEMIRYVAGKRMNLTVFTNGLAIRGGIAAVLLESETNLLYWSLHAADEATFLRMQPARRKGDWPRMIEAMRDLVRRKRLRNNRPHIIAAMVINADNFSQCEAFMDLCADVGVDAVRYQIMHSCSSTESLLMDREQFAIAKAGVERAKRKAEARGLDVVANIDFQLERGEKTYDKALDVLSCHWSHDLYSRAGCLAGWFFSRSFADGLVSFCCHDKIIGSLKRTGFRDLWFSDPYRRARQAAKAFDMGHNIDLSEAGCGGPLLSEDCAWCGNYEFINKAFEDLKELDWLRFLSRVPPG